ncbi:HWE histidine kinase domain-containing protein [Qipengyuania nanhaisediminis]|uniref:HWE histidine kinase domain-containing protein n=1 Tax=Qipengyuania nanhaisediminis TaxID=604088 RepID=UPI0038B264A9
MLDFIESTTWPTGAAPAPDFCGEEDRLTVLGSYGMDGLQDDDELNRLAAFAANLCGTGIALVSIVEEERQRFLAHEGIEETETPRSWSFCAHAMLGSQPTIIRDARENPMFAENPLVTGAPFIRFYAGIPLISSEGAPLGTLCVIDPNPKPEGLNDLQMEGLEVLGIAVLRRLEAFRQSNRAVAAIEAGAERLQFVLDSVPDIAWSAAPGPVFDYFNARFTEITGQPPCKSVEDWSKVIHPDDYEASASKFAHAAETATVFEDQWRLRQADGSYRYVLSRAIPSTNDPATARWYGTLTDIDDAYRISQERELLAGELAHRIKNIFSVISGLVTLHSRGDATLKVFADTLSNNIRALARAQDFALKIDTHDQGDLKGLLNVLMAPYGVPGQSAVSITGDTVATGQRATTPLALVFHELATNSAKYGALSTAEGQVSISVASEGENVAITWRETGGPEVTAPETTGFGTRLVTMAVQNQLGGRLEQDWLASGLVTRLVIAADRLAH